MLESINKILNFKNYVDQHARTHLISAFFVLTFQNAGFLMAWLIYEFAYICMFCVRCCTSF